MAILYYISKYVQTHFGFKLQRRMRIYCLRFARSTSNCTTRFGQAAKRTGNRLSAFSLASSHSSTAMCCLSRASSNPSLSSGHFSSTTRTRNVCTNFCANLIAHIFKINLFVFHILYFVSNIFSVSNKWAFNELFFVFRRVRWGLRLGIDISATTYIYNIVCKQSLLYIRYIFRIKCWMNFKS